MNITSDQILLCRIKLIEAKSRVEYNIKYLKDHHYPIDDHQDVVAKIDEVLLILLSLLSDNAPNTAGGDSSVKPNK